MTTLEKKLINEERERVQLLRKLSLLKSDILQRLEVRDNSCEYVASVHALLPIADNSIVRENIYKIARTSEQTKTLELQKLQARKHAQKYGAPIVRTRERVNTCAQVVKNELTSFLGVRTTYTNDKYITKCWNVYTLESVYTKLNNFARKYEHNVELINYCTVELYNMFLNNLCKIVYGKKHYKQVITTNHGTRAEIKHAYFYTKKLVIMLMDKMNGKCGTYETIKKEVSTLLNDTQYTNTVYYSEVLERMNIRAHNITLSEVLETLNNRELRAIANHNAYELHKHKLNAGYNPRINYIRRFNEYLNDDGTLENEVNTISGNYPTPERELLNKCLNLRALAIVSKIACSDNTFNRVYDILLNDYTDNISLQVIKRFKTRNKLELLTREQLKYLFC